MHRIFNIIVVSVSDLPESPDWMPPQYTVQFWGLDWFTTSSYLSCFGLAKVSETNQLFKKVNLTIPKIWPKKKKYITQICAHLSNHTHLWFPDVVLLWSYNNLQSSEKTFHYILDNGFVNVLIHQQEH